MFALSALTLNMTKLMQPQFRRFAMQIMPIRTVADNEAVLKRIEQLFDAEPNTSEGDELEVLITLVSAFEDAHFPIEAPDPIAAIQFRMEQQGLVDADMVPFLGQRSRVSEVLNRQRSLSLNMIRKLNKGLKIPLSCLVKDYQLSKLGSVNMTNFQKGQLVTHSSVNKEMKVCGQSAIGAVRNSNGVSRTAVKKGFTSCSYQVSGQTVQRDFPTNELVPVESKKSLSSVESATKLYEEAVLYLIKNGTPEWVAAEKVNTNFTKLNNSNLVITLERLCADEPFDLNL